MIVPKHFDSDALGRLLDNRYQQDRYLGYYYDRMDFWYSVLMAETDPRWMEVAFHNLTLVAKRLDRLYDLLD